MNRFPFILNKLSDSIRQVALRVSLLLTWISSASGGPLSGELTFEKHVRPIFKAMCFHCHGDEEEKEGELDVRLVRLLKEGGKSGSVIQAGNPAESLLWQRIESDEMPDGSKKLTAEEKQTIRDWIKQGAKTARPEPDNVEDVRFTLEELEHWAFQPVHRTEIPLPEGYDLATPIDGFIATRLAGKDLPFSKKADLRTRIRRVTMDLTGLLPTPEEVETFTENPSLLAWSRLIDRLLASPEYGIRWGRHWLDSAGYAESDGGTSGDSKRPHAWRYRDYVIISFNKNEPVNRFIREQLSGDEMIEGEIDPYNARHLRLLTATGFMRMAPDPTQTSNSLDDRNMAAADAIQVISSSMLGLTLGCARCHDHKYDPIGTDDYYGFRAIFDPVFPLQNWQQPNARLIDLTPDEDRTETDRIEKIAKEMEEELNGRKKTFAEQIQKKKLDDVPQELQEDTKTAVLTPAKDRTNRQKELLDLYPMVKPVSFIAGFLVEYDNPAYRKFEKEREKITEIRETKPPKRMIMVTRERPGVIPQSTVFFRGNPANPGKPVDPAGLGVLNQSGESIGFPVNQNNSKTTGRRTAYAKHLTDGRHPLTARVFVNRVWHYHFGRGIVATPGNFGLDGSLPSHPNLLDWLADDFVRHGWDQKRLHRMILLSTTYQQQSTRTERLDEVDPDNILLARANLKRLEAEAIRDSILSVTENLKLETGGPSVPVTVNGEGKAVIGIQKIRDGLAAGVKGQKSAAFRRSAFIEVQRSLPLNLLATFDQPVMSPNCDLRRTTTVPTQALWFLNDEQIVELTDHFSERLISQFPESLESLLHHLFSKVFSSVPTQDEIWACRDFLNRQTKHFRKDPDEKWQNEIKKNPKALDQRSLASLCQVLLASNRFLYID